MEPEGREIEKEREGKREREGDREREGEREREREIERERVKEGETDVCEGSPPCAPLTPRQPSRPHLSLPLSLSLSHSFFSLYLNIPLHVP